MKTFLKLILKIAVTPIFVPWIAFMIFTGFVMIFIDWLYDEDEDGKRLTQKVHKDFVDMGKRWFTTL